MALAGRGALDCGSKPAGKVTAASCGAAVSGHRSPIPRSCSLKAALRWGLASASGAGSDTMGLPTVQTHNPSEGRNPAPESALRHLMNATPFSILLMEQPIKLGPRGGRERDAVHAVAGADRAAIG